MAERNLTMNAKASAGQGVYELRSTNFMVGDGASPLNWAYTRSETVVCIGKTNHERALGINEAEMGERYLCIVSHSS
jgi:hypothetical protein